MNSDESGRPPAGKQRGVELRAAERLKAVRKAAQTPWVPRMKSPVTLWAGSKVDQVVREFITHVRPRPNPQRPERFAQLIHKSIQTSILIVETQKVGGETIEVEVLRAFGKPLIVSYDIQVTAEQRDAVERRLMGDGQDPKQRDAYELFLVDLLDRSARAVWDNPEIAPVGLRGRIAVKDEVTGAVTVMRDLRDAGFQDEIARPQDSFERYGAPASDPNWRP